MKARLGGRLVLAEIRVGRIVAVIDGDEASIAAERERLSQGGSGLSIELIERSTWETMHRLVESGDLCNLSAGRHVFFTELESPEARALRAAE